MTFPCVRRAIHAAAWASDRPSIAMYLQRGDGDNFAAYHLTASKGEKTKTRVSMTSSAN